MNRTIRNRLYRVLTTVLIALLLFLSATYAQWFENGTPVCVDSGYQTAPAIASDSRGEAVIAWQGAGVVIQRVNAFGDLLWDPDGVVVCSGNARDYSLVADPLGGAAVAWSQRRGARYEVLLQRITRFGRLLFGANGLDICTANGDMASPAIEQPECNAYIVAWQDSRGIDADIFAQKVNSAGTIMWDGAGLPVCSVPGDQESPAVVIDGAGGVIAVWIDARGPDKDIYAQRISGDGAPLWTSGGIPLCAAAGNQDGVRIMPDGSGGAVAVWQDGRDGSIDIYAQRIDGDGSPLWEANGVAVCAIAADQIQPSAVADGAGGIIVAWSDYRGGEADIMAQRLDASGSEIWQAGGVALCASTGNQSSPFAVADGEGGAIVSWQDDRGSDSDIHAQRISASGSALWIQDGAVVCNAPGDQLAPKIAPDGAGGAFIPWEDRRSGESDIYIQRINAMGSPIQTPVAEYSAFLDNGGITVKWTISEEGEMLRYSVWRSEGRQGIYKSKLVSTVQKGRSFAFTDDTCIPGLTYTYRIEYRSGNRSYSLFTTEPIHIPAEKRPHVQSHPNPFNPSTTISYELPARGRVNLDIYDAAGRRIVRLVDAVQDEGLHRVVWDGRDSNGSEVASGIYFSRLVTVSETVTQKMVLIR
jgi:hypothetical protein